MMMATWSLLTANADLKAMAPARVLLVSAANGAAVLWFIVAGAVRWPETLAMLSASIVGGYLAARLTLLLPSRRGARLRRGADRNRHHRVLCACDVNNVRASGNKAAEQCGSYPSDHIASRNCSWGVQCEF